MKKLTYLSLAALLGMSYGVAQAHTPLCSCYEDGDNILCEGGFSDGSSASGVDMYILDADGNEVMKGKMDENSEFTFEKPEGDYIVKFDAGEGHRIEIKSKDIQ